MDRNRVTTSGVDERVAILSGLRELGIVNRNDVVITVIRESKKGFLGFGAQSATVRVEMKPETIARKKKEEQEKKTMEAEKLKKAHHEVELTVEELFHSHNLNRKFSLYEECTIDSNQLLKEVESLTALVESRELNLEEIKNIERYSRAISNYDSAIKATSSPEKREEVLNKYPAAKLKEVKFTGACSRLSYALTAAKVNL
jgi:predicted RNA-binding protein Jag